MSLPRKIIHIDMDAFYASVEQRERPELRGQAIIVGGDPDGRGVVAACSYEARRFGVHSAMPCGKAKKMCPKAIFLRPRMELYKKVSAEIMALFSACTALVEPLSVDEAFLDVSVNHWREPSATRLAETLRRKIREKTGLTASAGVSCNKFLAKIASGYNKPDGLTVITPEQARDFIAALPIGKFYGVGAVTEQKMRNLGIHTGVDLLRFSAEELISLFGKPGRFFYEIARGRDERPVLPSRERKSIGTEVTLESDLLELSQVCAILADLLGKLSTCLAQKQLCGRTLTLKVRYNDFTTVTRSTSSRQGFHSAADIQCCLPRLLSSTEAGKRKIRLLGLSVSNLSQGSSCPHILRQLPLPYTGVLRIGA